MKKLAGETLYYGLSSILARFVGFLLTPLYAYSQIIDVQKMGHLTELMAYTGMILILFSCRMEAAYFRFGKEKEEEPRAFSNSITSVTMVSFILAVILFIAAPYIAPLLGYYNDAIYFQLLALIMMVDAFCEIPLSKLRFEGNARRFATIKMINIGVNVFFNLFFVLICPYLYEKHVDLVTSWFEPENILVYIFVANLLASLTSLFLLRKSFGGWGRIYHPMLGRMWVYAWPLIIVSLVAMFNEMFGRVILKWFLDGTVKENEAALGIYGVNYRLAAIITLFTQAFRYAAEPFFFRQSGALDSTRTYAQVAKYYLIFSILGYLTVSLFIDIFKVFVGPRYYAGLVVIPILLMANVFSGLYFNVSVWYRLKDRTLTGAGIALAGAVLTVFFNWLLIPQFGYIGSAYATLICYFSITVLCYFIGQRVYAIPYEVGVMGLFLISAVIIQQLHYYMRLWMQPPLAVTLIFACAGILLFGYVVWVKEKEVITRLIKSFRSN